MVSKLSVQDVENAKRQETSRALDGVRCALLDNVISSKQVIDLLNEPRISSIGFNAEQGADSSSADRDEYVISDLKASIEALGDGRPMWSRGALTARCTQHIVFINGSLHEEGTVVASVIAPDRDLARLTFEAVKAYRETIPGQATLVWRSEPTIERQDGYTRVRVRLCFEPTLIKVANGVWIEERLNLDAWGC